MSIDFRHSRRRGAHIRAIAGCLALLSLGACASGARTGAMTVPVAPDQIITDNSPIKGAIAVGAVAGGDETNPLWKSEVSDGNFRTALDNSLALSALKANASPAYILNAKLVSLHQPMAGFDMTVTSTVEYSLLPAGKTDSILNETVVAPYTANFSDAFVGMERLRLANEGAMRENIKEIISRIVTAAKPGGPLSGASPLPKLSSAQ